MTRSTTAFFFTILLAGTALVLDGAGFASAQGDEETPTTFIVGFHELPPQAHEGGQYKGGQVVHHNERLNYALVEAHNPNQFRGEARNDANVRFVDERTLHDPLMDRGDDVVDPALHTPTDPSFTTQYGPGRVRAPEAWDTTLGSAAKWICVVDTGVRYTHEDIAGARWLGGIDTVNDDNDPMDDSGHGTHVAGTAAGTINNAVGISGIAQAGILGVKGIGAFGTSADMLADGIDWCTANGAHIISMSWRWLTAWGGQDLIRTALENADAAGLLLIAAAGNDGCDPCVNFPATMDEVMAVTCTTATGAVCGFSSRGPEAEVSAPGDNILSTCFGSDTDYCNMSGTSMSTPHVSGVAALIWSYAPSLTAAQVRTILRNSAEDLGAGGFDNGYGYGEVDAKAGLDQAITRALNENFDDSVANGWTLNGMWHLTSRRSNTATKSLWYGQESTGNYDNGATHTGTATTGTVTVPSTAPKLSFKSWYQTEGGITYDQMFVEVSNNGGTSWTSLLQVTDTMSQWNTEHLSLSSYAGQNIKLRFRFDTIDSAFNNYEGWYVDDVQVTGTASQGGGGGGPLTIRDDDDEQDTWYDFDFGDDVAVKRLILPSDALTGATSAALWMRAQSVECGASGNNHRLTANGFTASEHNPCSVWSNVAFEWKSFNIPLAYLTAGATNSFEVYEIAGDWLDRNIHWAIDSDRDFGRTDASANGNNVNGELMWYLVIQKSGGANAAPDACFSVSPASGTTSTVFSVNAGCSTDDGGVSALQVRWDWESDGFWDTSYTTTKTATKQYSSSGTKAITLEVKDAGALTDTASQSVLVNNPPSPCFTVSPSSGTTSTVFSVNAGCSTDDLTPSSSLQVRWDWENDGVWDTSYTTTKTATKQYSTSGTKTIKLDVQDGNGATATITASVLVNSPPTACFSATPTQGGLTTTFQFNASCSTDDLTPSSSLQVRWDFENDGTWDTSFSTTKTASKQYTSLGAKTVKVEVRDGNLATSQTTRVVNVHIICSGSTCIG